MKRSRSRTLPALAAGLLLVLPLVLAQPAAAVVSPALGTASTFAVLGGSAVSNTGATVVTGDLGVSPGSSISGFPPGQIVGGIEQSAPVSTAAQADIGTAMGEASAQPCDTNLSGLDLGGMTLPPAVYCFDSSAQLTGVLRLDAQGSPTAAWLFQVTSALTTASDAAVVLVNGGTQCVNNVNWLIGSSATVGSASIFLGNILANTSITFATGANGTGSLYAHTGAVTLDTSHITTCDGTQIPPPPPLDITTTPSGNGEVGGTISDSATLSGGLSPSGDVTFQLFGPADPNCEGPFTSTTGTVEARTASSGDVTVTAEGTYDWVATYNGDDNNGSAVSGCGSETVIVTRPILTGRAYGLKATATLAGIPLVNVAPTPDTGAISTSSSSTTTTPCRATLSGLVGAHALCANVTTVASPGSSTATASVADATVGLPAIPAVTLTTVGSTSTTTCAGSTGSTTIAFLKVGNTVVISSPTNIAPNTGVTVGVVSLILNEQIPFTTPDMGLTVNAVHLKVNVVGLAKTDIVVASSESDIGNCP